MKNTLKNIRKGKGFEFPLLPHTKTALALGCLIAFPQFPHIPPGRKLIFMHSRMEDISQGAGRCLP